MMLMQDWINTLHPSGRYLLVNGDIYVWKESEGKYTQQEEQGDFKFFPNASGGGAEFFIPFGENNPAGEREFVNFNPATGNVWEEGITEEMHLDPTLAGQTIEERGLGMETVTAEDMRGKNETEMLEWIINTRYGGKLPDNVSETDILTQIRTKLPKKDALGATDWYGIQDTADEVMGEGLGVYGGMGTSMREQVTGQKKVGKDVYALEEGKDTEWTSNFRTFLSNLPSATGT